MRYLWIPPLVGAIIWLAVCGFENVRRYGNLMPSIEYGHDNVAVGPPEAFDSHGKWLGSAYAKHLETTGSSNLCIGPHACKAQESP